MRRPNSEPHIPDLDKAARLDDILERTALTFELSDASSTRPASKRVRQRHKVCREDRPLVDENGILRYRASRLTVKAALKNRAVARPQPARLIVNSVDEQAPSEIVEGGRNAAPTSVELGSLQFVSRSISTSDSSVIAAPSVRKVGSTVAIR